MMVETKRSWTHASGCATCVRVPVFIGHAEAVNVEFDTPTMKRKRESPAGR